MNNTTQPPTNGLTLPESKSIGWDNDTAAIPGTNLMVSASLGLYAWRGKFYIQIITAHNENNYIVEIPAALAITINVREGLEATKVKDENTTTIVRYF